MKIKNLFLNNIGLKLLALLLAFITLMYVGEATKTDFDRTVLQKLFSGSDYISKRLYIKPVFVGNVPEGYVFRRDETKIFPEAIIVIGPAKFLSGKEAIATSPIDLSEHTKTGTLDVGLESISRSIKSQRTKVQIFLRIEKAKRKSEK